MGMLPLIAAACGLMMVAPAWQPAIDVAVHANHGGHALLRLGAASVSIAFDSGHECPKSNGCGRAAL